MIEPLIYAFSAPGRCGASLPALDVPTAETLDPALCREEIGLPQVSEVDVMRHFVRLSQMNYGVDTGMYPLGSCTMKYNPKVNEAAARLPGMSRVHPYQPLDTVQGCLQVMYETQRMLAEIAGMAAVSLQPSAGAHGELSGVLMIRAYHLAQGDTKRKVILIPDSAHGTNPASTAMAGYEVKQVATDTRGNVDLDDLRRFMNDELAGMMLTNPNTLGLFDEQVMQVARLVHAAGGLMYGDGANMNALLGIAKPGELGFDVMHYNLHKTFSTPHGGGGPGSGPVACTAQLADFLPGPLVVCDEKVKDCAYRFEMPVRSIGRVKAFYGNFGVIVRAYAYLRMIGADGLREVSEIAVLNANYVAARLKETYRLAFERTCMHECVLEGLVEGAEGVHALDIAKRLIDYGVHPPTNYFPLIVPEALMIEPTETESKESVDYFCEVMLTIAQEARENPELLHGAPHKAPLGRLDEVKAARDLILTYQDNA